MKNGIVIFIVLFVALIVGCGGSGVSGGSNPAGPKIQAYFENLLLKSGHPTVSGNYIALNDLMNTKPKTESERNDLVTELLSYFSDDFKGKNINDNKDKIKDTTLDYLKDYTIKSYKFIPATEKKDEVGHSLDSLDNTVLVVKTYISINVYDDNSSISVSKFFDIRWKKYSDDNCQIISGFPVTRDELGI